MFQIDNLGKSVNIFLHFQKIRSPVGLLKAVIVEKGGMEIQKNLQDSLIHRWSQLSDIMDKTFLSMQQDMNTSGNGLQLDCKD